LARYESNAFGPDYQDNLFTCLFNLQKVTRQVLSQDGATFKVADSDFVVSDNKDFHPTMWSKTPTAVCSSSIPAAGTNFVARHRSS